MNKITHFFLLLIALAVLPCDVFSQKAELLVSSDGGKTWAKTVNIVVGTQATLQFKIIPNGKTNLKMAFPVFDVSLPSSSVPKNKTLMNSNDWDKVSATSTKVSKSTTKGIYEIPLPLIEPLIFSLNWEEKYKIELQDKAIATCKLQSKVKQGVIWKTEDMDSVTINLSKVMEAPVIKKFTSDKMVIVSGEKVTISWNVSPSPSESIQLFENDKIILNIKDQTSYTSKDPLYSDTKYKLVAKNGGKSTTQEFIIKVYPQSTWVINENPFNGDKQMNLFTYKDKLYALCLNEATKDIIMQESDDGLTWKVSPTEETNPKSYLGFKQNKVPISMAGSPSIVYKDKVYLIGGSRFDPNIRSNLVYFYDFNKKGSGWQKIDNAPFSPRMGQACVVTNKQIWVLGGCTEQGATDEIWTFNNTEWIKLATKLPGRRTMASVIKYGSKVQLFGGFADLPGFTDKNILPSYSWDSLSNKWESLNVSTGNNYVACAAASCKGDRIIVSAGLDTNKKPYRGWQLFVNDAFTTITNVNNAFSVDDYYAIQAIPFKGIVWIASVKQDGGAVIDSFQYFAYLQ